MIRLDAVLNGRLGDDARLHELIRQFTGITNARAFPCIFSTLPFSSGEISFTRLDEGGGDVVGDVVALLRELCSVIKQSPDEIGVIFVDQVGQPDEPSLDDDFRLASRIVQAVMQADASERPGSVVADPADAKWMLWLDSIGLFLNFSSPRHLARKSRNVGGAFTIIAQARESFDRFGRSSPKAKIEIRRRLHVYDNVSPHPNLGSYGEPSNREALQFFLGDGLHPLDPTGACLRDRA